VAHHHSIHKGTLGHIHLALPVVCQPRPSGQRSQDTTMNRPIRVLVADDHAIVRYGICALLATEQDIVVVGQAQDGEEAVEAIHTIATCQPGARILVLTGYESDEQILPAIRAGVRGFLLKVSEPAELTQAIRQVHRGEASLHPAIARFLLQDFAGSQKRASEAELLTDREVEVLRLVAQGQSNREISDELAISEATVRTHVSNILGKLNLCSRTQAALYALREGLASLHDITVAVS
jgi:NarL family two-component system response regulator LiaR